MKFAEEKQINITWWTLGMLVTFYARVGVSQWYQWYTNIVQGFTNGTIGNTIFTNGNAIGTIGSPNGTIGTNGKPMLPLVSQWYHWLPMVPLVKLPMVPLGEPRTEPIYVSTGMCRHYMYTFQFYHCMIRYVFQHQII